MTQYATLTFDTGRDTLPQIRAEVVYDTDEAAQHKGLGRRQTLGPNEGMLFSFHERSNTTFWMKDVPFPLDMIFIGDNDLIVHIEPSVAAMSLDYKSSPFAVWCVLEVNGGWAAANGVVVGTRVRFRGLP